MIKIGINGFGRIGRLVFKQQSCCSLCFIRTKVKIYLKRIDKHWNFNKKNKVTHSCNYALFKL